MSAFQPCLSILPPDQRRLWPELETTPRHFVLYGGTALALRLGHRQSVDFDFFANAPFDPARLLSRVPYLKGSTVVQREANTLTCIVDRGGPVRVSFFGGLALDRVQYPEPAGASPVHLASLLDLAATKVEVVQARPSTKDYLDIDALIRLGGVSLGEALGAAAAIYGSHFNPMITLKALAYYGDGDLDSVPAGVRSRLTRAVNELDMDELPAFTAHSGLVAAP